MLITNTNVYNIHNAIRGMRNPMNSWDKSDSHLDNIGKKDINLAVRLIHSGPEHAKFLRQIFVSCDISAPLYFWSEMDTYKVGTTANSTSTIHRLVKDGIDIDYSFELMDIPNEGESSRKKLFKDIVNYLNTLKEFAKEYPENSTDILRMMKEVLPMSFIQKRTWTSNYAVLRNIYYQRKNHILPEWSKVFVEWIDTLPYSKEFIKNEM